MKSLRRGWVWVCCGSGAPIGVGKSGDTSLVLGLPRMRSVVLLASPLSALWRGFAQRNSPSRHLGQAENIYWSLSFPFLSLFIFLVCV